MDIFYFHCNGYFLNRKAALARNLKTTFSLWLGKAAAAAATAVAAAAVAAAAVALVAAAVTVATTAVR